MMGLPIAFYALRRNVKRAILGPGTLESTAFDRETLCPSERTEALPAIFLPGQLERVVGAPPESTKEVEIEHVMRRDVTHAATIAYHIRNAVLLDGQIYAGSLKYPLRANDSVVAKPAAPAHFAKAALASSLLGNKYFFHWLRDDCTAYLLARQFSIPLCIEPGFPAPDLAKYQHYFDQECHYTEKAFIDHLAVFQDHGQNRLKRDRYLQLNDAILRRFGNKRNTPLIYLRRGNTGASRIIENEPQVIEALSRRGFAVVDLAAQTLEGLLENLTSARVVVSMEGSQLGHCVFAAPAKSAILALQPADRFASVHRGWTMCLGVRFGFVVGRRGESGYVFSSEEVLRTVDLLMKEL